MEQTVNDIVSYAKRRLKAFAFDDRAIICEDIIQRLYDVQADAQNDAYFEQQFGSFVEE